MRLAPGELVVERATSSDDPAIQRLLASITVPGRVVLTFERSPSYFASCEPLGPLCQVLVARHRPDGGVVGVAARAVRPVFVNGQVEEVGYITDLRVDPRFRGRWLAWRFLRGLRDLHADGRVGGYLALIADENAEARGVLVDHPRPSLPTFREIGRLTSLALLLRRPKPPLGSRHRVSPATRADLPGIVGFLRRHGAARQFFPVYSEEDFGPGSRRTLGFEIEDLHLARRGGELVGMLGLWDRSGSKQTVVQAYTGLTQWGRPFYDIGARLAGARPLPAPGQRVALAYASFICVAENDPSVFRALLRETWSLAARRGYSHLVVGLVEDDPLLAEARRYVHLAYRSRLYSVCWEHERFFHDRLDGRTPYVDTASV